MQLPTFDADLPLGLPSGRGWGARIGSLAGVPVLLHVTFLAHFALALASLLLQAAFRPGWARLCYTMLLYVGIHPATMLVHAASGALAARNLGAPTTCAIVLWPLGGLAGSGSGSDGATSPTGDLLVALAGPLSHAPQALFWLAMMGLRAAPGGASALSLVLGRPPPPDDAFWLALAAGAVRLNIASMALNLLAPAAPLAAGRVFRDVLLLLGRPAQWVATVACGASAASSLLLLRSLDLAGAPAVLWCAYETALQLAATLEPKPHSSPGLAAAPGGRHHPASAVKATAAGNGTAGRQQASTFRKDSAGEREGATPSAEPASPFSHAGKSRGFGRASSS